VLRKSTNQEIHMKFLRLGILLLWGVIGCNSTNDDIPNEPNESMYFPPIASNTWETKSVTSLGWKEPAISGLLDFLEESNSKSFMILVNGRIVMEEYYDGHTAADSWQWNSAGKALVTAGVGIAQDEGLLNINSKVSAYLGEGWTNETVAQEELINVRHLLTMTSGLNDASEFIIKQNLTYLADAGTRWSYHNVFQKLMEVVEEAAQQNFEAYLTAKLLAKLGMDGTWNNGLIFTIFHSTTRSMARFGLLALNKGVWDSQQLIPTSFFTESITSSQELNPAYGYLWWLNGKNAYMIPGEQTVFDGSIVPNAPADMYAAMGASDQRIYVVPSKNMVIIRMGNTADPGAENFALSGFDYALWEKLNALWND